MNNGYANDMLISQRERIIRSRVIRIERLEGGSIGFNITREIFLEKYFRNFSKHGLLLPISRPQVTSVRKWRFLPSSSRLNYACMRTPTPSLPVCWFTSWRWWNWTAPRQIWNLTFIWQPYHPQHPRTFNSHNVTPTLMCEYKTSQGRIQLHYRACD